MTESIKVCPDCNKSFKNLMLHILKTHKKFVCVGCKEMQPIQGAVGGLAGKNYGKMCNKALCEECFT